METIRGRVSRELGMEELKERLAGYNRIVLDLGTGDGRYARHLAERDPSWFVFGVDACRENLHKESRTQQANLLFAIAEAQALPWELNGLVSHLAINFPWGSLLHSLLVADPALMHGLAFVSTAGASVEIRLNSGALAEAGTTLELGTDRIHSNLARSGWLVGNPHLMDSATLHRFPSTWAKRLAFGRDPRAFLINGNLLR
jgi:16S rRNA (adenine(1408)-N(1))-methyltransferase